MTELSIFLHDNYPILFIMFLTTISTMGFNKFIATKPWVKTQITTIKNISDKQIMAVRVSHEELAKKVQELVKINTDVVKQSASFQASFKMFLDMQNKQK
jgi:hypothetical protein